MLKLILLVGIPASSKSTWAKNEIAKDPENWVRINNDDLRAMANGSVYFPNYEKFITEIRQHLIKTALKSGKNVILDNLNLNKIHWETSCQIARSANVDVQVIEKPFFIDLEEAITRDSKREGTAKVGEEVIKKWWKYSGGKAFAGYQPKIEIFTKGQNKHIEPDVSPMVQNPNLPRAVVFDNDGTISLLNGRNPYDASTCDEDLPHSHVIECLKLYFQAGYQIIFVSGREEKDRAPTERFYQKHFPEIKYQLYLRQNKDMRKDVLIKQEIFENYIKDKYYVAGWFDDRLQVCQWVHQSGLPLFRVNNPNHSF